MEPPPSPVVHSCHSEGPARRQAACIERKGARLRSAFWKKLEATRLWISPKLIGGIDGARSSQHRANSQEQAWRDPVKTAVVELAAASKTAKMCEQVLQSLFDRETPAPGPRTCLEIGRRRNSAFRGHCLSPVVTCRSRQAPPNAGSSAPALYAGATTGEAASVVEAPVQYPAHVSGLFWQRRRLARALHAQREVRTLRSGRLVRPSAPLTLVRKHLGSPDGPSKGMLSLPRPVSLSSQVQRTVCPSHRLSPRIATTRKGRHPSRVSLVTTRPADAPPL